MWATAIDTTLPSAVRRQFLYLAPGYGILSVMNYEVLRKQVAEIHQTNTQKVLELLNKDFDLSHLNTIIDPVTAEIYQRLIPQHAQLCEANQNRPLTEIERCDLAVSYGSLYPTFGHEGIITITAHYLATRPDRQAKNS